MDLFDYVFPLFMILFPAVFTLFYRDRSTSPEDAAAGARLQRLLWSATAISILVFLLLAGWRPPLAYFMWTMCFPLWFLLAMPLLRVRDPGWREPERGEVRSASLQRRDQLPPGLRLGWTLLVLLWLLLLCLSIAGLALAIAPPAQWWLLAFNLVAGFELAIFYWAMRRSLIEPEAMAPGESETIRNERSDFHRLKLRAWFLLAGLAMLVFSLPPLIRIWYGNDALPWAIAIGAGGGTLGGIGGAVFGTLASIRRARINRLSIEISRSK